MNPVVEFLTAKDGYSFDEGVAVLSQYCKNRALVMHLTRTRNMHQLSAELKRLAHDPTVAATALAQQAVENVIARSQEATKQSTQEPVAETPEPPQVDRHATLAMTDEKPVFTRPAGKRSRLEDMPTPATRELWQRNNDRWHQKLALFERMKLLPEGEELAEVRAQLIEVSREHQECWALIDKLCDEYDHPAPAAPVDFNVSTYRAYIAKAIKRGHCSDQQLAELQSRVDALIAAKVEIKAETLEKLRALGIAVK